jgi:2-polyprenyl-6-methoxyphenol hydroxylase-like FAD-dependent oxidoreductase
VAPHQPTRIPEESTATTRFFDVIVVGGGIAGSSLAGVLARSGLGVLVVEKEPRFRDRIRGEGMLPWGYADALALGLRDRFTEAGGLEAPLIRKFRNQQLTSTYAWADDSPDGLPAVTFLHTALQEVLYAWAGEMGATMLRPAKAVGATHNGRTSVRVIEDGRETEFHARLVLAADGKLSAARSWFGAETCADPETNKFGGVLVSGVRTEDQIADTIGDYAGPGGVRELETGAVRPGLPVGQKADVRVNWFWPSVDRMRLYLSGQPHRLRELGVERSFDAIVAVARATMPEGVLDDVVQEGPIGFFPNNDIWSSRVAGDGIALIGDAAGAPDPSNMGGISVLFHDVRVLSDLLLADDDWSRAVAEYDRRRTAYFAAIREWDRWGTYLKYVPGAEGDRIREGHQKARQADPTLAGFGFIEARGPEGLVADEAARRTFFGEDLA